jgi:putative NADH-flavin reductase
MSTITVFGASGKSGRLVVQEALAAGHTVRAFVRSPDKLALRHERLTIIQGDATDARAVADAIRGADAVISALGPTRGAPKDAMQRAAAHIVAGMRQHRVRRLVAITGAGVRDARDRPKLVDHVFRTLLQLVSADVLRDSEAAAAAIRASDLDWTIVRVPRLVDGPASGRARVGYVGRDSGVQVARGDVAAFMLGQLEQREHVRAMPMLSS